MRVAVTSFPVALMRVGVSAEAVQLKVVGWTEQEFLQGPLCGWDPTVSEKFAHGHDALIQKRSKFFKNSGGRLVENDPRVEIVFSEIQGHHNFGIRRGHSAAVRGVALINARNILFLEP